MSFVAIYLLRVGGRRGEGGLVGGVERVVKGRCTGALKVVTCGGNRGIVRRCFRNTRRGRSMRAFSVMGDVMTILMKVTVSGKCLRDIRRGILSFFPRCGLGEGRRRIGRMAVRGFLAVAIPCGFGDRP